MSTTTKVSCFASRLVDSIEGERGQAGSSQSTALGPSPNNLLDGPFGYLDNVGSSKGLGLLAAQRIKHR
jgi:hypothetical protein